MVKTLEHLKKRLEQKNVFKNIQTKHDLFSVSMNVDTKFMFNTEKQNDEKRTNKNMFYYLSNKKTKNIKLFFANKPEIDVLVMIDDVIGPIYFVKTEPLFDKKCYIDETDFETSDTESEDTFLKKASMYDCIY